MRVLSEEKYFELVEKMQYLNTQGELSQKMAMGIAFVLGRLEKVK